MKPCFCIHRIAAALGVCPVGCSKSERLAAEQQRSASWQLVESPLYSGLVWC